MLPRSTAKHRKCVCACTVELARQSVQWRWWRPETLASRVGRATEEVSAIRRMSVTHRLGGGALQGLVNLNLDDLALNDLRLFLDAHSDGLAERLRACRCGDILSARARVCWNVCEAALSKVMRGRCAAGVVARLREGFRLGHLEREDLRGSHHRKGRLLAERLAHAHRDGGLARAGLPCEQDCAAGDLALFDHLDDDACGLRGCKLVWSVHSLWCLCGWLTVHALHAHLAHFDPVMCCLSMLMVTLRSQCSASPQEFEPAATMAHGLAGAQAGTCCERTVTCIPFAPSSGQPCPARPFAPRAHRRGRALGRESARQCARCA